MPSTRSTILENWPGPKTTELPRKPTCHFALKQSGANLDFHLQRLYHDTEVCFHYFSDFEELVTTCQRFPIDAIIISGYGDLMPEIELVQAIKLNVFLSIVPVVLYHPDPDDITMIAAYENGVEDFIHGPWKDKLVRVRIRRVLDRSRRDLSINPSTQLPGPTIIDQEISSLIKGGGEFAVCYADLDNFKAYNDYYGYYQGDKVIQMTARVIKDVVFDLCREGFVGHVAGDDFIFITPPELVDVTCSNVIKVFDALIPYKYADEDRERGYIVTKNRRGEIEKFPILTISIAVEINTQAQFEHIGELSKMLADLKTASKRREGSNYLIERRRKY